MLQLTIYIVDKHLEIAKKLAKLLDNQFEIFGFKFGIDPLIGLVPGIGDISPFLLNLYFAWIAYSLKLPSNKVWQILWYGSIDILLGLVPVIGDYIDFTYKSYAKSLEVIENHLIQTPHFIEGEKV